MSRTTEQLRDRASDRERMPMVLGGMAEYVEPAYLSYSWDSGTSEHVFTLDDSLTWNHGFIDFTKTEIRIPGATVGYTAIGLHCDSHKSDPSGSGRFDDQWALVAQYGAELFSPTYGYPTASPWKWSLTPADSLAYIPLAYIQITGTGISGITWLSTITPAMLATYMSTRPYCGIRWTRAADGSSLIVTPDMALRDSNGPYVPIDTSGWVSIEGTMSWTITTQQSQYVLCLEFSTEAYLGNNFTKISAGGSSPQASIGVIDVDANMRITVHWTRPLGIMLPCARGNTGIYFTPTSGLPAQYTSYGVLVTPSV